MKNDPRSYDRYFYNCVKKPEKIRTSSLSSNIRRCYEKRVY